MPPPRPGSLSRRLQKSHEAPFFKDDLMNGEPDCSWKEAHKPRLRAWPGSPSDIKWLECLGHGIDGILWKVETGGGYFAVKLFWQSTPPTGFQYWAIQRECQNAAVLELLRTALSTASEPIVVFANPEDQVDARNNLFAFTTEGRGAFRNEDGTPKDDTLCLTLDSLPKIRRCFGWLRIRGVDLPRIQSTVRYNIRRDEEYWAIMYEYIPQDDQPFPEDAMQKGADFLWLCGFAFAPIMRKENWLGGVLLDMADIIHPWSFSWNRHLFRKLKIKDIVSK